MDSWRTPGGLPGGGAPAGKLTPCIGGVSARTNAGLQSSTATSTGTDRRPTSPRSWASDFEGEYTEIVEHQLLAANFGGRALRVEFIPGEKGVTVCETFEAESTHSEQQQRQGWQAILDNFARHVEASR